MHFYVCNQVYKFWGRILAQEDQNWGFGVKKGGFPKRKTQEQGDLFWCNSSGKLELTRVCCPVTDTHVLGVPGLG